LPNFGVTSIGETFPISSEGVTPLSSLLRAHVPLPLGSLLLRFLASFEESLQLVLSPCCPRELPDVISENLSLDAGSVPRRFHRVRLPVSSSVVIGLPQRRLGSAFPRLSANHDFSRSVFSRLQIFLNVPASKFARPPDRLYRCAYCRRAAGAFTSGQYRASLPLHAPDMLTVRIQAIDSTRTFTLLDSQPCRLLTFAPWALPHFIATTDLAVTVSLAVDFPVEPVIRPRCSTDFSVGRGRFLQLLGISLSPCCP
jgi:hypothetical protein